MGDLQETSNPMFDLNYQYRRDNSVDSVNYIELYNKRFLKISWDFIGLKKLGSHNILEKDIPVG